MARTSSRSRRRSYTPRRRSSYGVSRKMDKMARTSKRLRRRVKEEKSKMPLLIMGGLAAGYFFKDTIADAIGGLTGTLGPKKQ